MLALPFPAINPVLFSVGPFAIRWYALAYVAGILLGWKLFMRLDPKDKPFLTREKLDDLVVWITFGILLGGRLGYVLFYKPGYYLEHLSEIPILWHGGMSFHGGLTGVILASFLFCRKHGVDFWRLMDRLACLTPIGLFLGRIANFINAELYGRVTDVPWAMVFPNGGELPRHPSQLYEAGLEGIALFILLLALWRRAKSFSGMASGLFLLGYGAARIFVECFREPDAHLGFLYMHATMGQLLSLPLVLLGGFLCWRARKQA